MLEDLNPNAIIILVVMIIGGIRWFIEQFRGVNRQQDDEARSEFEDLYEEARLEILERQERGDPDPEEVSRQLEAGTVPQPPLPPARHRPTPPPIPTAAGTVIPPTIRSAVPERPKMPSLTAAEKRALANFEAHGKKPRRRRGRQSSVSAHVRKLLSNPTNAQDAIVLADILGPPKGIR